MKKVELRKMIESKMIESKMIKSEKFNTNNAWGFGGGYGVKYFMNNEYVIYIGTASYRHTKATNYYAIYKNSDRIVDTSSKSTFETGLRNIL